MGLMTQPNSAPSTSSSQPQSRELAFGSVVASGGLLLLLVAGGAYFAAEMLGIESLRLPASIAMSIGLGWFVVARILRVGKGI